MELRGPSPPSPPSIHPPAASTGACLPFRYGWSQSADVSPQAARVTSAHVRLPAFLTTRPNNEGSVSQGGQAGQEGEGREGKTGQSGSHLLAKKTTRKKKTGMHRLMRVKHQKNAESDGGFGGFEQNKTSAF